MTGLSGAAGAGAVKEQQGDVRRAIPVGETAGFPDIGGGRVRIHQCGQGGPEPPGVRLGPDGGRKIRLRIPLAACARAAGSRTGPMRTRETFNCASFAEHPEPARRMQGRIVLITDSVQQHRLKKACRYLGRSPDAALLYLPAAKPDLSAAREARRRAKHRLTMS